MKRLNQYYAVLCANLLTIEYGLIVGWSSPILPILQSDKSPLPFGKLTEDDASWLSSVVCIGSLIGSFITGIIAEKFGRKLALYVIAITTILSWLLLIVASSFGMLLIARLISGIVGGGAFLVVPLYIVEVAEDEIRGTLGSLFSLVMNFGMVLGYAWGGYLDYYLMSYLCLIFPVIFIIGFCFVPETPAYLASKNKIKDAEKSLKFYRGQKDSSIGYPMQFLKELNNVKSKAEIKMPCTNNVQKLILTDFTKRSARIPILLGIVLFTMMQANGGFMIMIYIATLFHDAGTRISSNLISIIVGMVFLIGTYVATILVDRLGRRPLIIYSSMTTGIFMGVTGLYFYLKSLGYDVTDYSWISIITIAAALFNSSWGLIALPFVIVNEMLPIKTRGIVSMVLRLIFSLVGFFMLKYFYVMKSAVDVHGCLFFFAINCFVTAFIMFIWLPETKEKSIDEIIKSLEKI